MTIQPPSEVVESQVREAGLLERPRGGHRGERVLAAKERARTLGIRVDDEGFGQQGSVVRRGQTDHEQAGRQWNLSRDRLSTSESL